MNDTLMWLLGRVFPAIMASNLIGANALKLGAIIGTMSISFLGMRLWVFFQKRYDVETPWLPDAVTERRPVRTVRDSTAFSERPALTESESTLFVIDPPIH